MTRRANKRHNARSINYLCGISGCKLRTGEARSRPVEVEYPSLGLLLAGSRAKLRTCPCSGATTASSRAMARQVRGNSHFTCPRVSRTRSRRAGKRHSRVRRSFRPPGSRSVSTPSTGSETLRIALSVRDSESFMTLTSAAAIAYVLNFVIFIMIAVWYVAPWLAARRRGACSAAMGPGIPPRRVTDLFGPEVRVRCLRQRQRPDRDG